jgi:hypothetical protein
MGWRRELVMWSLAPSLVVIVVLFLLRIVTRVIKIVGVYD